MAGPAGTQTLDSEYETLTEGCGLLDRSERGKLALTGSDAVEFLNGQVTNELADLRGGEGRYAAFLTHKGKMLGDLRILLVEGEDSSELLIDTERVALQPLFDMIHRFKVGYDVELHKRTLECALVSLIGPRACAVAAHDLAEATEHSHVAIDLDGVAARAIRTDVGVDLLCDATDAEALAAAIRQRGARDVSEEAAEVLRIELGRPRYGLDLDDGVIPQEAGLNERAVSFTKGCYVGQETVARLFYKGKPNRHLRGLRLSCPATTGEPLLLGDKEVGRLGSVARSPTLGGIGLAVIRREATPGDVLAVHRADGSALAEVVELPFRAARAASGG